MTTEVSPTKNGLMKAFDDYKATEEYRDMEGYVQASKPSAVLFMAFSAGWVARRNWDHGLQGADEAEQDTL